MKPRMRIGTAVFDAGTGEVVRGGASVRLEPQPAVILAALAERPGTLVSHDELRQAIWDDATHVNFQQSLHYGVRQVRRAIDDGDGSPSAIESIPRRGYRLRVPVERLDAGAARVRQPLVRATRWAVWASVAAAVATAVAIVERRPNDHHRMAVVVLQTLHDVVY